MDNDVSLWRSMADKRVDLFGHTLCHEGQLKLVRAKVGGKGYT